MDTSDFIIRYRGAFSKEQCEEIIQNIEDQKISGPSAKKLLEIVWSEGGEIQKLIQKEGLEQISNDDEIEKFLDEAKIHFKNVELAIEGTEFDI